MHQLNKNKLSEFPLFVDVDGTYLKTDLLFESFIVAIRNNPLVIIYCFFWLTKGIGFLKYKLSMRADLDISIMPKNPEFLAFLNKEKNKARKIILATAGAEKYAALLVSESKLFDSYLCSDKNTNLKSRAKLSKILKLSDDFAYAGNDKVDFVLFSQAKEKYLVNATQNVSRAGEKFEFDGVFDSQPSTGNGKTWLKQLRLHQWLKNLLIFVPLMVSGLFTQITNITEVSLGFIAFSFLASATYIVNDLFDLSSDRQHPRKKYRPLAAAKLSILAGLVGAAALLFFAFGLALLLGLKFIVILLIYLGLTLFYSFVLKKYVAMDTVALAMLYTLRILAGTAILSISVSFWLFAFSIFIFLSLALVKRCAELKSLEKEGKLITNGRDYRVEDYSILVSFGISSAMLSLLMFSFYINNNALTNQYQEPDLLWVVVLGLCYWLMRMWIKTHRGEMHDDPIVYSLKDKGSIITILTSSIIMMVALSL